MVFLIDLIYNLVFIPIMWVGLRLSGLVSSKARERIKGISDSISVLKTIDESKPRIWVHSSSMGEFEQVIPVLEQLRAMFPSHVVIGSFYSPSGFHAGIKSSVLDLAVFLPDDTLRMSYKFAKTMNAKVLLFARYDVWRNVVLAAKRNGTPVVVLNATFPSSGRQLLLRNWTSNTYGRTNEIIAVTRQDQILFESLLHKSVSCLSDTRADRIQNSFKKSDAELSGLIDDTRVTIVLGSVWPRDMEIFQPTFDLQKQRVRFIIVPHEPSAEFVSIIALDFDAVPLSSIGNLKSSNIVVDAVGQLLKLYQLADAVYVGGGFGAGVHSLLEPAGKGVPISCGPEINRSRDALGLRSAGALTIVQSSQDATRWVNDAVLNAERRIQIGNETLQYFSKMSGSSHAAAEIIAKLM
ncbi:MAG: hypothetical protein HQ472_01925 [Ignavibacteria bacterium]|nr:hypothetical protein [Ignavibacteria bacterium]